MTKRGDPQSGGRSVSRDGLYYTAHVNAPFSVRLTDQLRAGAIEKAASKNLPVGQYLRDLVEADLSGTTPRRRRGKYDDLRQDLAKIHAAIISCGNQIKRDRDCTSDRCKRLNDDRIDQEQILLLKDAVSSLVVLARSIGAR